MALIHKLKAWDLLAIALHVACKAGGFAGGMIRKQRLRTTGRHFERANKGETGERKKEPLAAAPLAVAASPLLLVRAKPNNTASYAGYLAR